MLKRYLLLALLPLFIMTSYAQPVKVKFVGRDRLNWISLDSVVVTNLTRSWSETVVAPDSIIELAVQTGVACYNTNKRASLMQNVPNPFYGTTEITYFLPQEETVHIAIFDILGKEDVQKSLKLGAGYHTFKVNLSQAQTYFFTVSSSAGINSIKMVNLKSGGSDQIEYMGWKHDKEAPTLKKSSCQAFAIGDKMQYTAYANVYGEKVVRTVTQCQYDDATILFDMVPQTHLVDQIVGETSKGISFTANYTYDSDKHLTQITFSDSAGSTSYMYFSYLDNRIQTVHYVTDTKEGNKERSCHFSYNNIGLIQQRIEMSGVDTVSVEQFEYDNNMWLHAIIVGNDTNVIKAHYDRNGNITQLYKLETDSSGNVTDKKLEFKYDYHRKPYFNADYLFTEELYPHAMSEVTRLRGLAYNNMTAYITVGIQWVHDYNDDGLPISIVKTKDKAKGDDFAIMHIFYKEY
ncbi:MAG: T9SS type A sorting domain-containing protein [Bacteroidales bacterium]|nr:T9SS type A sorting domain-containing protein [Bacteroidales bacterium]